MNEEKKLENQTNVIDIKEIYKASKDMLEEVKGSLTASSLEKCNE